MLEFVKVKKENNSKGEYLDIIYDDGHTMFKCKVNAKNTEEIDLYKYCIPNGIGRSFVEEVVEEVVSPEHSSYIKG